MLLVHNALLISGGSALVGGAVGNIYAMFTGSDPRSTIPGGVLTIQAGLAFLMFALLF